jgi:hypothetical protein
MGVQGDRMPAGTTSQNILSVAIWLEHVKEAHPHHDKL